MMSLSGKEGVEKHLVFIKINYGLFNILYPSFKLKIIGNIKFNGKYINIDSM